jgi:hypothetical protein
MYISCELEENVKFLARISGKRDQLFLAVESNFYSGFSLVLKMRSSKEKQFLSSSEDKPAAGARWIIMRPKGKIVIYLF